MEDLTRQEQRAKRLEAKYSRMKKHGRNLGQVYKNVILRKKDEQDGRQT